MAGFILRTDLDAERALRTVKDVARNLKFSVNEVDDWELSVQKGNLALSIFIGAFVAYCNFRVSIHGRKDNSVEIEIERNSPWWTGILGVSRVKSRAKELADRIEDAILDQRGEILKRGTF